MTLIAVSAIAEKISEPTQDNNYISDNSKVICSSISFATNAREHLKTLELLHHELINGMHVLTTLTQLHEIYSDINAQAKDVKAQKIVEVSQIINLLISRVIEGEISLTSSLLGILLKAKSIMLVLISLFENNESSDIDAVNNFIALAENTN